jgi:CheY-like chemotaxis protein
MRGMPEGACRVLVVEDPPAVREMLADYLGLEGFEVRTAANGREALAVLERLADLIAPTP